MLLPASNLLNVLGLLEKENFLQKYLAMLFFTSDLGRLKVNVLEANSWKTRRLYQNPYQYILLLIMNHQLAKFGGEGS